MGEVSDVKETDIAVVEETEAVSTVSAAAVSSPTTESHQKSHSFVDKVHQSEVLEHVTGCVVTSQEHGEQNNFKDLKKIKVIEIKNEEIKNVPGANLEVVRARGQISYFNKITNVTNGTKFKGGTADKKGKIEDIAEFGHKHGEGATVTKRN